MNIARRMSIARMRSRRGVGPYSSVVSRGVSPGEFWLRLFSSISKRASASGGRAFASVIGKAPGELGTNRGRFPSGADSLSNGETY